MRTLTFFLTWILVFQAIAKEEEPMAFKLKSTAFEQGKVIPSEYTCDGKNMSPSLSWQQAPSETKSFVLISDDPDAHPLWTHWILYNIPGNVQSLEENLPKEENLSDGSMQGINDFRRVGYGGPCPPSGTHRYFFKLYALDTTLNLSPKATRQQVELAMKGHVLGEAELMGTYQRNR